MERLPVGDLSAVAVQTNDKGPRDAVDVWWLLFGRDDKVACSFPQGATGEQLAVDYLMKLPAFDYDAMIDADVVDRQRGLPALAFGRSAGSTEP